MASQMRVRLEGVWDHAGVEGVRVESVRVGAEVRGARSAGGDCTGAVGMLGVMLRCVVVVVVAVAVAVDVRGARFKGDGLTGGSVAGASKSLGWLRVATILKALPNARGDLCVASVLVLVLAHEDGTWKQRSINPTSTPPSQHHNIITATTSCLYLHQPSTVIPYSRIDRQTKEALGKLINSGPNDRVQLSRITTCTAKPAPSC